MLNNAVLGGTCWEVHMRLSSLHRSNRAVLAYHPRSRHLYHFRERRDSVLLQDLEER